MYENCFLNSVFITLYSFLSRQTVIIMLQHYAHTVPAADILGYSGERLQGKKTTKKVFLLLVPTLVDIQGPLDSYFKSGQ